MEMIRPSPLLLLLLLVLCLTVPPAWPNQEPVAQPVSPKYYHGCVDAHGNVFLHGDYFFENQYKRCIVNRCWKGWKLQLYNRCAIPCGVHTCYRPLEVCVHEDGQLQCRLRHRQRCGPHSCPPGQQCVWRPVPCDREPCPRFRECVPKPVNCGLCIAPGEICVRNEEGPGFHCEVVEPPRCTPYTCPRDHECSLVQVQCVRAPCPPVTQCSPLPDYSIPGCWWQQTPKPPSCENVRCETDKVCVLQKVECVREPCHPVPVCVSNQCIRTLCIQGHVCVMEPIPDNPGQPVCLAFPDCLFQATCSPRAEPRPGFCPPPEQVSDSNANLCHYDQDCPAGLICCPGASRGGLNCTAPLHPDPCRCLDCPNHAGTCAVRDGRPTCLDRVCTPGDFFFRNDLQCYCNREAEIVCTDLPCPTK